MKTSPNSLSIQDVNQFLTKLKTDLQLEKCGFKTEYNNIFCFYAQKHGKVKIIKFGEKDMEKTLPLLESEIKELLTLQSWD